MDLENLDGLTIGSEPRPRITTPPTREQKLAAHIASVPPSIGFRALKRRRN